MKKIGILGSTGSIGKNTIEVIKRNKNKFKIVFLATHSNVTKLINQGNQLNINNLFILNENIDIHDKNIKIGYEECNKLIDKCDIIVFATTGTSAVKTFFYALNKEKIVAMANKEILVSFSEFIKDEHRKFIIPVDSEHSAIFQGLKSGRAEDVKRIILTASGGPFIKRKNLNNVKLKEALKHPRWKMGKKITIDSATLFNKGLEAHEAKALFGFGVDMIDIVIHPESIIHSLVEFRDGSMIAQLSVPDMRIPIQYALTYPERIDSKLPRLSLTDIKKLTFEKPDNKKFPLLKLALDVLKRGKTYPAVMCKADEICVQLFIENKIEFKDIYNIVKNIVNSHNPPDKFSIDDIIEIEKMVAKTIRGEK